MAKHTLKILRCSHRKILKVCLAIFTLCLNGLIWFLTDLRLVGLQYLMQQLLTCQGFSRTRKRSSIIMLFIALLLAMVKQCNAEIMNYNEKPLVEKYSQHTKEF